MSLNSRAGVMAASIVGGAALSITLVVLLVNSRSRPAATPSDSARLTAGNNASRPNDMLMGKWQSENSPGRLNFREDGQLIMAGPKGSAELRYRRLTPDILEWSRADGSGKAIRLTVKELGPHLLILIDPDGLEKRFSRVE